jgi:serine O-acetyltransferase
MNQRTLQRLKRRLRGWWVIGPERLWLASIALHRREHWVLAFWLKQLNGFLYHNSLSPGASVSPDVFLGHNSLGIVINRNVEIGRRVTIWQNVTLAAGRVELRRGRDGDAREDDSDGDGSRRRDSDGSQRPARARIIIEDDVKIGANSVVMAPRGRTVRIGRGARVGAGTVVTRDVPAGVVIVSAAPRLLGRRDTTDAGEDGPAGEGGATRSGENGAVSRDGHSTTGAGV